MVVDVKKISLLFSLTFCCVNNIYSADIWNWCKNAFNVITDPKLAAIRPFFDSDEEAELLAHHPVVYLNNCIFEEFKCECGKCKLDEDTGVHYKELGDTNSENYVFFFHGMQANICTDFNNFGLDSAKYHIVNLEYNSYYNKDEKKEYTYGFTQIDESCNILFSFIKKFLKTKKPAKIIISGHSHGNTFALRILKKFMAEDLHTDKLSYLGCKGYLDFENALCTAAKCLANEYPLVAKLFANTTIDAIRSVFVFFAGADTYELIKKNNDNAALIQEIVDKIEPTNQQLSKDHHNMHTEDFQEMFQASESFVSSNGKIPFQMFYAKNDVYVGEAFKEKPVKFTVEQKNTKKDEEAKAKAEMVNLENTAKVELKKKGVNTDDFYKLDNKPVESSKLLKLKKTSEDDDSVTSGSGDYKEPSECCACCRCKSKTNK